MSWVPRPEAFVFDRVLRREYRRGWVRGFGAGAVFLFFFLLAVHLVGTL